MPSRQLKPEFIEMLEDMRRLPGGEIFDSLASELASGSPAVGVRFNSRKASVSPCATTALSADNLRPVPWALNGFWIDGERPRFTFDPALHQGVYYVQDPSSMAVGTVVKNLTEGLGPIVCIDACAAPGGKTTAAIDALADGSLVIANEFDRQRAEILKENIIKWGYTDVVVSRGDTSRLARLGEIADLILADVPCSGEGMMRKDDDAVRQWSEGLVDRCACVQREIVANLWKALKPGGFMIYSTCTFNVRENEDNVRQLADELGGEIIEPPLPLACGIAPGLKETAARRFIPGRVRGEGLFIAVIRKNGSLPDKTKNREQIEKLLQKNLDIIYRGDETGVQKGKDFIPAHSRAMAAGLSSDLYPRAEVDYPTAIAYLRRMSVTLEPDVPRGIVLLTFGGLPLGFVKNLAGRANNLYPKPYAIRQSL